MHGIFLQHLFYFIFIFGRTTLHISRIAETATDYLTSQKSNQFIFDNEFAVRKIDFPTEYLKKQNQSISCEDEKKFYIYIINILEQRLTVFF
jgi:hypothetical protein